MTRISTGAVRATTFARKVLFAAALVLSIAACVSCGPSRGNVSPPGASAASAVAALRVEVVKVVSKKLSLTLRFPGELQPYQVVAIYPRVTGFVKWIGVDRGSHVKGGETIARLEAPEIVAQRAEAEAKLETAEAQRAEAEAKLSGDESTYQRLKAASATPGVISGNEIEVSEKSVEADRARSKALGQSVEAAKAAVRSVKEMERYLELTAPFDGIVTERNVHPGALVGPAGAAGVTGPMLRIEQVAQLRLVVPVPEANVAGISEGTQVEFTVTAFPGETFAGVVARIAHAVEEKTRTMPVELDVRDSRLSPGMFAEVLWPVGRPRATLAVPNSAVAKTQEQTFVVRVREGKTEWVNVKTGITSDNWTEIFGNLAEGDLVATRGTDELRPGTAVTPHER